MTLDEIQKKVDHIEQLSDYDYEAGRSREDDLRNEFIEWITTLEDSDLKEKALLILTTNKMDW